MVLRSAESLSSVVLCVCVVRDGKHLPNKYKYELEMTSAIIQDHYNFITVHGLFMVYIII